MTFSRRLVILVFITVFAINIIAYISVSGGKQKLFLVFSAPLQNAVTCVMRFSRDIWDHYFTLVSVSRKNQELTVALQREREKNIRCKEAKLSNLRYRRLLSFRNNVTDSFLAHDIASGPLGENRLQEKIVAAQIVGKSSDSWSNKININKGFTDGIRKSMPVVSPLGVVGVVTHADASYSVVILIIDRACGVDALIQESRARGIIKGVSSNTCILKYVLRKYEVKINDTVVTSGFDAIFPKGLGIGEVIRFDRPQSGVMFQEIVVKPFVDFEKLEEVLVILRAPPPKQP